MFLIIIFTNVTLIVFAFYEEIKQIYYSLSILFGSSSLYNVPLLNLETFFVFMNLECVFYLFFLSWLRCICVTTPFAIFKS